MDTDSFELVLGEWIESRLGTGEEAIAVNGKALRGIHRDQTRAYVKCCGNTLPED